MQGGVSSRPSSAAGVAVAVAWGPCWRVHVTGITSGAVQASHRLFEVTVSSGFADVDGGRVGCRSGVFPSIVSPTAAIVTRGSRGRAAVLPDPAGVLARWAAAVFTAPPAGLPAAEHAATPSAAASISARTLRYARRSIGSASRTGQI
jgi:hypothetical protein